MGPCRTCGKESNGDDLKLFERRHRKLLFQLKDITGVLLKTKVGWPQLICSCCCQSLRQAHKFREKVLKVQASFASKCKKENSVIEATEFVPVCVKEEKVSLRSDVEIVGEKEIQIAEREIPCKKENDICNSYQKEINALEISPNEENTLEDTKISILEDKFESSDASIFKTSKIFFDNDGNTSEISSRNDDNIESDVEYHAKLPRRTKAKIGRKNINKSRTKLGHADKEKSDKTDDPKDIKPRKRRKDTEDHPIFICDQCGNHFTCRHHFKLHLRRHTGDKQCSCELCPDKFFTSSELRRHMRKHTGERPFPCQYCDRRFTDYSTRIKHERTHTNERPFMCSQCGKSFTTSYILKNHMLTHTGERHFKCDVCAKAFTRRTHLQVHFRSIMHKQAVEKITIRQEVQQTPRQIVTTDLSAFVL